MTEVLKSIFDYLVSNYALYLVATMSIIVSFTIAVLSLIKIPIKRLTSKIKNERLRKLINKVFIVIAFGISFGAWLLLNIISEYYFPLETVKILLTGAFSIVIYAFGDGVITKPKAKQLIDSIIDFADDKDNKQGESAVEEYLKKVK